MTTKAKTHPLNGMHTAGIFSDMSVDGPEIGTLVLVIDRAKNLPNRKTIGKQDPYCAARLGKEAKKTTTDIRGGQTPKWDQELRFTVHDSPDYYQIKVSVFNDDKRTELIGEAWIDLRDIVVPGGGQSDQWHQLACRGKYAGEVRIEVTYYDNRAKPEKAVVKAKPPVAAEPEQIQSAPAPAAPGTAAGPRPVPKRRPLPSDPVTGKTPALPSPVAPEVETPPRPQPNPAPAAHQQIEYNQVSAPAAAPLPAPAPVPAPQHYKQPPQDRGVELGTPSRRQDVPSQQYRTPERPDQYPPQQDPGYRPHPQQQQQQQLVYDPRHGNAHEHLAEPRAMEDDRPPPPPAHRSRAGSNPSANAPFQATPPTMRQDVLRHEAHRNSVSGSYPGRPTYKAYDSAPPSLPSSQYPTPEQGQPSRHYSYDPAYEPQRTMQATVEDVPESPESSNNPRRSSGRWPISQPQPPTQSQSYSQPQPPAQSQPYSQSQPQLDRDREYDLTASPAPLALSSRNSNEAVRYPPEPRYQGTNGYQAAAPEMPQRQSPDYAPNYGRHSESSLPLHIPHSEQRALTYRGEDEAVGYSPAPAPVPAALVPGIDPAVAQEISDRAHHERRQSFAQPRGYSQALVETQPRGRTMNDRYSQDVVPAYNNGNTGTHGRAAHTYTNGPSTSSVNVVIKSRAYSPNPARDPSPNPHHTIRRKSVSPRPPVDPRKISGIPFGPDSYDAINPHASTAAVRDEASLRPDYSEATGKIITHDGREVDPSDHLPVESWAPEPEPKPPSSNSASARPSPAGPQPAPTSGRRPLRVAGRTQSMLPSASSSSAITFSGGITDHVEPVSSGHRNRLQKKAGYRQSTSAIVPIMSGANGPGVTTSSSSGNGPNLLRKSSGASGHSMEPPSHHDNNFSSQRGTITRASTFDNYTSDRDPYAAPSHHSTSSSSAAAIYGTSPGSQRHHHQQHNSYNSSSHNSHLRGVSPGRGPSHHHHQHPHHNPYPAQQNQYSRSTGNLHSAMGSISSSGSGPPIPAKIPLALPPPGSSSSDTGGSMSGALQLHSSSVARRAGSGIDDGYGYGGEYDRGRDGGRGRDMGDDGYDGYSDQYGYGGSNGGGGYRGKGGGGGGGGMLSLEEEFRQIDIGTGRSSRRHGPHHGGGGLPSQHGYHGHGGPGQQQQHYGGVYGQGGY